MTKLFLILVVLMMSACSNSDGGSAGGVGELTDDEVLIAVGQYLEENPQQAEAVADALEKYLAGDPQELQAVADVVIQYINDNDINLGLVETADAVETYLGENQL